MTSMSMEDPGVPATSAVSRLSAELVTKSDREVIENALCQLEESGQLQQPLIDELRQHMRTLAEGRDLLVFGSDAELTTNQAAATLGVSRPHLIRMCEQGEVEFHWVGQHRRISANFLVGVLERRAEEKERAAAILRSAHEAKNERVAKQAGLSRGEAAAVGLPD